MQALIKVTEFSKYNILDVPLLEYIINTFKDNNINCVLISDDESIKDITKHQYTYCKEDNLVDYIYDEDIIVVPANIMFINNDIIESFMNFHIKEKNDFTVLSLYNEEFINPKVIRKNKRIEITDLKEDITRECYSGVYLTNGNLLKEALREYNLDNAYHYFNDYKVGAFLTLESIYFINNLVDVSNISKLMKLKINEALLQKNIYIIDKDNTYISPDTVIEEGTIIEAGSIIYHSRIGKNNKLLGYCRIINSVIGDDNVIENSSLKDSFIGCGNKVGPYAQFRNNTNIGNYNRIGNFVEIKDSMIASYTNAAHLAYIGNCDCGSHVNFGCGSITVNYDGKNKYKTIIKDNAFIGCNSNLIAPIVINERGFIAAGSTITNDVEESSLAIARARQINKDGYLKEKL